jgi:formate/nitrite transporter FocA (FNT family)
VPKPGSSSPHLDRSERSQVERHAMPRAIVIHELLREEGESELERTSGALAWSGLAAGLSMGFSFLGLALIRSALPQRSWTHLIDSAGYTVGFLAVILGRQALFTESTLTATLPVLVRRNRRTLIATLRFWAIVLSTNLLGTWAFAALMLPPGLFPEPTHQALLDTGREMLSDAFWPTLVKAVLAGWMIALMVWLLPNAGSARIFVVMLLTYIVGIGHFAHIVAGSVEAAFAVLAGQASVADYLGRFMVPALLGNTIGGVGMVALLNHAPLQSDLEGSSGAKASP